MNAPVITIGHVGSIPLILHTLRITGFIDLLNESFPIHKNWEGLPIGETVAIWICYLLTQHDHRMCKVEGWIRSRIRIFSVFFKRPIFPKYFTDDRLSRILDKFSNSEDWNKFEIKFNESFIRVYGVEMESIRIDMTTANSGGMVTKDGILQFGNSKDDPTRPQIKIALATLDPLGIPLTVSVVPGNSADDPLYVPIMERVFKSVKKEGLLFLGDCKMGAILTRCFVANNRSYYACPLSEVSHSSQETLNAIHRFSASNGSFTPVFREYEDGEIKCIAEGFEETVVRSAEYDKKIIYWPERLVYAKSFAHGQKELANFESRIEHASEDLLRMNKRGRGRKVYKSLTEVEEKVVSVLKRYQVQEVLSVTIEEALITETKRKYGNKPQKVIESSLFHVTPHIKESAYLIAKELFGWRVFATNKPREDLSFENVVLSYREQFIIEHQFNRLKGVCLSLTPIYIQKGNRIDGLVKLLTLALKIIGLIEIPIHDSINKRGKPLDGLYDYNPKRALNKPKAERILEFFDEIYLSTVEVGDTVYHTITGVSAQHREILDLMGIDIEAYGVLGVIQ